MYIAKRLEGARHSHWGVYHSRLGWLRGYREGEALWTTDSSKAKAFSVSSVGAELEKFLEIKVKVIEYVSA